LYRPIPRERSGASRAQAEIERKFDSWIASFDDAPGGAVADLERIDPRAARASRSWTRSAARSRSCDREENRLLACAMPTRRGAPAAAVAGLAVFTLGILVLAVAVFYFIRREIGVREQTIAQQRITSSACTCRRTRSNPAVNGILIADAARPDHPLVYVNVAFEKAPATPPPRSSPQLPLPAGHRHRPAGLEEIRIALREGRERKSFFATTARTAISSGTSSRSHRCGTRRGGHAIRSGSRRHHRLKAYEAELERTPTTISLTGLPNRNLFADGCSAPLSAPRARKARGVL